MVIALAIVVAVALVIARVSRSRAFVPRWSQDLMCSYSQASCSHSLVLSCSHDVIRLQVTGSDRDVSLELDVGYRSVSVSPKGFI